MNIEKRIKTFENRIVSKGQKEYGKDKSFVHKLASKANTSLKRNK